MSAIGSAAVLQRSPRVAYRELGGERGGVLLQLETGAYHGVDQIGALIWELLEGSPSLGDLLPRLRARLTDVPPDLEAEIGDFLTRLRERDLIEVVEPHAA